MSRPHVIGLTGSIGMGKSTASRLFREAGILVWDADAAVHALYARGGAAVEPVRELHPQAVGLKGVDRNALNDWIAGDPEALARLESVVHPLVAADRAAFIQRADSDIVVLDIPLLFEIGADSSVNTVVVVSAPAEIQRSRVLARPGMTEERFASILSKQLPDAEKRARADVVVPSVTIDETRAHIDRLIRSLRDA
ncbi:dephospho-CoA kinase [Palleronia marisminoris]|uniref:Dephospho-CoA kinase n=1 Tax=Palleronia marisminoris TaxID=315423 RepID=A0A1Y5SY20_9RHOB|nr:dephospho-CoA kinase [Palleronia marisminoris]SFH06448.1 dephospho-CoA kinase [Palleronia marisminoris]SLN51369.1 Dephospho-CoA kinase [Palleronia marisminoris]